MTFGIPIIDSIFFSSNAKVHAESVVAAMDAEERAFTGRSLYYDMMDDVETLNVPALTNGQVAALWLAAHRIGYPSALWRDGGRLLDGHDDMAGDLRAGLANWEAKATERHGPDIIMSVLAGAIALTR